MEKWQSRKMQTLSSTNTSQCSHFPYCTHTAEQRPNMRSSHLCGSPSTPGLHTLIQLCKFMTIWNQTISYNLEYLQELCLDRLDPNRRCHFFPVLWFLTLDKLSWLHARGWRVLHPLVAVGRPPKRLQSGFYLYPKWHSQLPRRSKQYSFGHTVQEEKE